jgi:hypothetical protein
MAGKIQSFNLTYVQYEKLVTEAQAQGIPITGDSGTASKFGVAVQWHWITNVLTIQVTNTPFFISASSVENKIAELVGEAQKE